MPQEGTGQAHSDLTAINDITSREGKMTIIYVILGCAAMLIAAWFRGYQAERKLNGYRADKLRRVKHNNDVL